MSCKHGNHIEEYCELCIAEEDAYSRGVATGMAAEREACAAVCREVAARYPTDVFPDDGQSIDCKSARMARLTAANIERLITERSNEKGICND